MVAHDSEGFEAGHRKEVDVVKNFIEKRSKEENINLKLHLIWCAIFNFYIIFLTKYTTRYCIEMSARPIQHAEKEFFSNELQGTYWCDL